ncbi:MAG: branched-chain amino acid ABC transporter permease [Pseudomonadota bacterium]
MKIESHSISRIWMPRGETLTAIILFALIAALPVFISGYPIYILPQYMLFGMLAMSLSLVWGFAGALSFGQGAFFAIGAYTMGLTMKATWIVNPAYVGLVMSVVIGGLLSAIVGYFLFSAGVRGSYFVLITIALSIITEQVAVSQSQITGGWNGMFIDRMSLTLGDLLQVSLRSDAAIYYIILPIVGASYFLLRLLTGSKVGKILIGIRENEERIISLGFNSTLYKTIAFTISGAIACLAGAFYGTHAEFVAPSSGGVLFSTEVVVWVAIGGRASLLGALLGGIVVSLFSNYLSAIFPQYWQLILGLVFLVVIVYFKGGVAGALSQFFNQQPKRG